MGAATAAVPDFAGAVQEGVNVGRPAKLQNLQAQGLPPRIRRTHLQTLPPATAGAGSGPARRDEPERATDAGRLAAQRARLPRTACRRRFSPTAMSEQMRLQQQKLAAVDAKIKQAKDQHKAVSDVLYGVNTPMDFAAALPVLEKMGVNTESLPGGSVPIELARSLGPADPVGDGCKAEDRRCRTGIEAKQFEMAQQQSEFEKMMKGQQFGLEQNQGDRASASQQGERGNCMVQRHAPRCGHGWWSDQGSSPATASRQTATWKQSGGPADAKKIATDEKARMGAQKATDFAEQGIGLIDNLLADPGLKVHHGVRIQSADHSRDEPSSRRCDGSADRRADVPPCVPVSQGCRSNH